nr:hypothetical protein [Tanacetum cinerariifolium]
GAGVGDLRLGNVVGSSGESCEWREEWIWRWREILSAIFTVVASLFFWQWELSSSSGNFFWQWKHIIGSRKTTLEVGMDQTFNSQQSSPKLDAASAIKFLELNALKS